MTIGMEKMGQKIISQKFKSDNRTMQQLIAALVFHVVRVISRIKKPDNHRIKTGQCVL